MTNKQKPIVQKKRTAKKPRLTTDAKPAPKPAHQVKGDDSAGERIQKVLARGGLASRREIERWLAEGRIRVNGQLAVPGLRLKAGDFLQVNERVVHWEKFTQQKTRVLLYHKPIGEVVTRRDPEGRPTVFTRFPELLTGRWLTVGRLDINTSGLLLVTNNGELANRLMHPSSDVEREYAVRILGNVSDALLARLAAGVELDDGFAKFNEIHFSGGEGANKWYYVTVSEGRNRLVRRLWESQHVVVSRLMRVRYGPVVLPEYLKSGSYYELSDKELDIVFEFAGLKPANAEPLPASAGVKEPSKSPKKKSPHL